MSNFAFLEREWAEVHEAATKAEAAVASDPRTACFYARRALELAVYWLYKHDPTFKVPYQTHLAALLFEPSFQKAVGRAVFNKARLIKAIGNEAVHSSKRLKEAQALACVRELFHVTFWVARTYARGAKPADSLAFRPELVPTASGGAVQSAAQLQALEAKLAAKDAQVTALLAGAATLDEELRRLRAEVAKTKKANGKQADTHDYSEEETRDLFIDRLLHEAGWALSEDRDREYEVSGMPNTKGLGYVDYVLWGSDGKPLGIVEAKRTKRSPQVGQQQAKLYADCLEKRFGQRPVIFYSNGYEHWLWDDASYAPRPVQGFLKRAELELLIQRRTSRKSLADAPIDGTIVERYYQTRAIRRIGEAFEKDHARKALVVMATGAGKTRTVIALCDQLMRANWAKRVLFLADRVALVNQAVNAFKAHLPDASPVNLVTERDSEGRVFVSTYPTMMGLIDELKDTERRFGPGHFDLIVIDEAHRSVYQKYRAIFEYFDSLLVGLTATPKDEIDTNTYGLFDLETGVPTDAYTLEDAVKDGFLVPPEAVSVPLKFQRDGISYDELSEDEQEQWDAIEWDDDGATPNRVEAAAVNKWLFNQDTVDKVLESLMTRGQTVAGGDRLGKTIVFAANQDHAEFIAKRFDANYPHHKGAFARVVHCDVSYVQSLIDDFSIAEKAPHIAISVDMLDTGIDVPEVVNLVFFKLVRSKTKFWQMIGRGTRLRKDLFGPGQDKAFFYVFDYCQNLEFFKANPDVSDGASAEPLRKRLFKTRLELIGVLDRDAADSQAADSPKATGLGVAEAHSTYAVTTTELRRDVASLLHAEVSAMNVANFVVRPKRRLVEKYGKLDAWTKLEGDALAELAHEVAGLPSEQEPEDEEAKRFDLLLLNLQLALLRTEPAFARLSQQVRQIAGLLEESRTIPMVKKELPLILDLQTDEWWQDVTAPMLETVRKRLRALIKLIEKKKRAPIYTNFEDVLGDEVRVELPGFGMPDSFERFRAKARAFLRKHEDHIAIHKLRMNKALTRTDLDELEGMLTASALGASEDLEKAKDESEGLGLFVRSLVGLDRQAAKEAFAGFLGGKTLTANQIEFVNLIVDHLTEHGVMKADLLYESPFTDLTPRGPEELFASGQLDELIGVLERIRAAAVA